MSVTNLISFWLLFNKIIILPTSMIVATVLAYVIEELICDDNLYDYHQNPYFQYCVTAK